MAKKKQKKLTSNTKLRFFSILKDTLKYYFKNIFYIFLLNIVFFALFESLIRPYYYSFIGNIFKLHSLNFNIAYYFGVCLLLYSFKMGFFNNVIYNQKSGSTGGFVESLGLGCKRFFPIMLSIILFLITSAILSLVVIGVFLFFYYFFSIYLHGFGDPNDRDGATLRILKISTSFSRSFALVKGNLLRFMIFTGILCFAMHYLNETLLNYIDPKQIQLDHTTLEVITFSICDFILIYTIIVFLSLAKIESDIKDEKDEVEAEERALMMQQALENKSLATKGRW